MSNAATDQNSSIDPEEIARFEAIAEEWWDPKGKFRPLHVFNPARLRIIRDEICDHFGCDPNSDRPLSGIKIVDIGCGGGLVSEPLARLGAEIKGIDASTVNIGVARTHAEQMGLSIVYEPTTAEALEAAGSQFDVVLSLEVVEHVPSPSAFLASCGALVSPGGLLISATLNRTLKALALAKFGAEYVLQWLPKGTHDWNKFVTPLEMRDYLRAAGLAPRPPQGLSYNPLADRWSPSRDTSVNYLMIAKKDKLSAH